MYIGEFMQSILIVIAVLTSFYIIHECLDAFVGKVSGRRRRQKEFRRAYKDALKYVKHNK